MTKSLGCLGISPPIATIQCKLRLLDDDFLILGPTLFLFPATFFPLPTNAIHKIIREDGGT